MILILGDQLFDPKILLNNLKTASSAKAKPLVFMREDLELCTHFKYHQQKIVFFLAAMRSYAEELRAHGFEVHYEPLPDSKTTEYASSLRSFISKKRVKTIIHFEIEDKFFESSIKKLFKDLNIEVTEWTSPMFLTPRSGFLEYLKAQKKPFMHTFYQAQRKRLGILVDKSGKPTGGKWSFDTENRKALPQNHIPPNLPKTAPSEIVREVMRIVKNEFSHHPGNAEEIWLPIDRKGARNWLKNFVEKRIEYFGPYEDALAPHSDFVYHSVLTPFLNTGLLTPKEVVKAVLDGQQKKKISLASTEGFVRQVIGWREFIRGIYRSYSDQQENKNFWNHRRRLTQHWYEGNTGIPPLDQVISKVNRYGYSHHIERLMVVGSLMLLLEISPQEAHRWFMEMYLDSADWVMGPNVFGMALFSDGGVFATKPYICGSNYYRKMGHYPKGDWEIGVDGLYWSFIDRHRSFFLKNPRLSMMVRLFDKMPIEKKQDLVQAADQLKKRLTK